MAPSVQIATKLAKWGKAPLKWAPPKSIEPKKLGWIRPDGKINFQSKDVAMEYAKNRAVAALKQPQPFEKAVLIKKNIVIGEVNGDASSCDLSRFKDELQGATIVHGHPSRNGEISFPISLQDYFAMIGNKLGKIVAYNKNGEFSELATIPTDSRLFTLLPKSWNDKIDLVIKLGKGSYATERYSKDMAKLYPIDMQARIEQGLHKKCFPFGDRKMIKALEKNPYTKEEAIKISNIFKKLKLEGSMQKMIHDFWKNFAPKVDCTYKTNFSNLT